MIQFVLRRHLWLLGREWMEKGGQETRMEQGPVRVLLQRSKLERTARATGAAAETHGTHNLSNISGEAKMGLVMEGTWEVSL